MSIRVKRVQGRPARGEGDVGRDRLVEAARSILRGPSVPELSRKAVADAAGVTPALVSYYFPEKDGLLAAAAWPLVNAWVTQLLAIIESPGSRRDRLHRAVALMIAIREQEASLVDQALAVVLKAPEGTTPYAILDAAYRQLRDVLVEGIEAGEWRVLHPDHVLFALWGMCKFAARSGEDRFRADDDRGQTRTEMVVDLALNGLTAR